MGLTGALGRLARFGRWVLPLGLAAGVLLPQIAATLRPALPAMVAGLLFLSAFRIGARQGIGSRADLIRAAGVLAVMQCAIPALVAAGLGAAGTAASPALAALVLVLTGSPISGAPNICAMMGKSPAMALRLLLLGTAILPVTALAVFSLWPALLGGRDILAPVLRLMAAVLGGGAAGFALRALFARRLTPRAEAAVDGVSTLLLAVMVVGLMSAVGPALRETPLALAQWLAFACLVNFGLQAATARLLRRTPLRDEALAIGVTAGNRNIALFLVALPPEVIAPLLLFIGCYQIPMFLTPLLMRRPLGG